MRRMLHCTVQRTARACSQTTGATKQDMYSLLSTSECSSSSRDMPSFVSNSRRSAPYCYSCSSCFSSSAIASRTTGKVTCFHHIRKNNVAFVLQLEDSLSGRKQSLLLQSGNNGSGSSAALFFALPCLFTAFLGTWQVNRRQWKVDLLKTRTSSLQVHISSIQNAAVIDAMSMQCMSTFMPLWLP